MNRRIKAALALLPYREMKELSRELAEVIELKEADILADAMARLAEKEDSDFANRERDALHSMFKRKKQITIQPYDNGWKIDVPAQNITIYTDDVRDGISQALDNLVAVRVLS